MTRLLTKRGPNARTVALLGVLLGYTLVIGLIERMIPLPVPLPGVKLGLANVAVLLALYLLPWQQTLLLVLLKCLLGALLGGGPAALLYSLAGSLLSWCGMLPLSRYGQRWFSAVGVSVAGAALHNLGQICAAALLLQSRAVFAYLPLLLLIGVFTGTLIGLLAERLRPVLASFLGRGKQEARP